MTFGLLVGGGGGEGWRVAGCKGTCGEVWARVRVRLDGLGACGECLERGRAGCGIYCEEDAKGGNCHAEIVFVIKIYEVSFSRILSTTSYVNLIVILRSTSCHSFS